MDALHNDIKYPKLDASEHYVIITLRSWPCTRPLGTTSCAQGRCIYVKMFRLFSQTDLNCHPSCAGALFLPLSVADRKPTDLSHSASLQRQQTDTNSVCPAAAGSHGSWRHLIISHHPGLRTLRKVATRQETNTHMPNIIVRARPSPT